MHDPLPLLANTDFPPLRRGQLDTLQVNVGYRCNQSCLHCHVNAGPTRREEMQADTAELIVRYLDASDVSTLDVTGGAPELNAQFRYLVREGRKRGLRVIDRCNLTILEEPGQEDLAEFLAENRADVVASMPCYLEDNVNRQRGRGAYDASVEGLRRLNQAGYGTDPQLRLNLVYNPVGPNLPPPQASLEVDYKRELESRFGVVFNHLWTITNMPIKRWRHELERTGELERYMSLLTGAYNESTIEGLMCRHQINVDPQGRLFDCDFNQALELPTPGSSGRHLWDYTADELADRVIGTGDHCFGCTAGSGSSCGGALS